MNNKESKIKISRRLGRVKRNRARVKGGVRARLVVTRSNSHIYVQVIDTTGKVIASANDMKLKAATKTEAAAKVGEDIAQKALAKEVKEVALDRSSYKYHGRVKALAEAARAGGLVF